MIDTLSLSLKPDFADTLERFEAWWDRRLIDRPPVTLTVRPSRTPELPPSHHTTLRDRWLDADFAVTTAIAHLEARDYPGDVFPAVVPNVGPELTATLLGCDLDFGQHTSWSHPIVHCPDDWDRIAQAPLDFTNPYWQAIERMTDLAFERCNRRYVVGLPDLHGNYDILAALRDPQMLCMDLMDCPEQVARAGRHATQAYIQAFERSYARVAAAGMPCTTWLNVLHHGPMYVPNCDFWCMVGNDIARDLILPDIIEEMKPCERNIFHLDGVQALRHLDLLLELPQLDAVQWVYGAGQGPARRWVDVYRRCQAAGKAVQVLAEDADDALATLCELELEGVWLTIARPFDHRRDADAFLDTVRRMTT